MSDQQTPYDKLSAEDKKAVDAKVDATLGAMKSMLNPDQLKMAETSMRNSMASNPQTLKGVVDEYKQHQAHPTQAQPSTGTGQEHKLTPEQQRAVDAVAKDAATGVPTIGTEDDRMNAVRQMLKNSGAKQSTGDGTPTPGPATKGKAKPAQDPASVPQH